MKTLNINLKHENYPIHISQNNTKSLTQFLKKENLQTVFVITQKNIKTLYGQWLKNAFTNIHIEWIVIPQGEHHKNLKTTQTILSQLLKKGAHRKSLLVAFGGGVVGDITGFVASIYMRGINFIQIPTTLLAQVDSSVGGKTAVDFAGSKNVIGRFHQPKAVFIFTNLLNTLSEREFKSGLAEVIKMSALNSKSSFDTLQKQAPQLKKRNPQILAEWIHRSVAFKAKIVTQDEQENNIRAILNWGHTLGHCIEALTQYKKYTHGEAVAMGISFACHLAVQLQVCRDITLKNQIQKTLHYFDLPTVWPRFTKLQYKKFLLQDKKRTSHTIQFILIEKLGKIKRVPLNIEDILVWL